MGQQDTVLRAAQTAPETARFLEELLVEVTELAYSYPAALDAIAYAGYADANGGWKRVGLNVVEDWEAAKAEWGQLVEGKSDATAEPTVATIPVTPVAQSPVYDVVVIGTGAGGAPILARLAQAGLRVVALEAGPFHVPERDFATDEREQLKLFWTDERLSAGENPLAFGTNNSGIGVGGSTLHFTAYTPRPHPDDFQMRHDFGVSEDWPFTYDDLEPYFTEVEQFLGVSGPSPYLWGGPRSKPYALSPLPLNGPALLMQRACETLGIRTSPAPNAALSQPYYQEGVGWRPACTNRGFCQAGCSVQAKGSMDVTYIRVAMAHGAEVRPHCFVTTIERERTGAVTGVVYVDKDGKEQHVLCDALFLCAGAIESPRLLLLNGIGNESGQVGKNFIAHPGLQVWGIFDEDIHPNKGIPGGLISEDFHRLPGENIAGGYLLQSIGVMPVTYAGQVARGRGLFGADLDRHMRQYNHVAGINIMGEGLPHSGNFLELSEEKDGRGLPKPRIHFTAGENEKRLTAHADKVMRAIWSAAGGTDIWGLDRYAHTLGTCRMGNNAESSVVTPDCRVWSVPNLYICDNSIFPSSLTVNPALTQIALSLRTADRFVVHST